MRDVEKEYNKFLEMIRKAYGSYAPTNVEESMWKSGYILGTEQALKKRLREDLTDQE
jgi:hypothetical protein